MDLLFRSEQTSGEFCRIAQQWWVVSISDMLRDTQQLISEGKYAQALRRLTPAVNEDKLSPANKCKRWTAESISRFGDLFT